MQTTPTTQPTETQSVSNVQVLINFLRQNYEFHENVLSGKVEFRQLEQSDFKELTDKALNSIAIDAEMSLPEIKVSKSKVRNIIFSNETKVWNPIREYLCNLPTWDGRNRMNELFGRLPGVNSEHIWRLSVWLRGAVAHWLQLDELHGNELVPTLIGHQGCGKTTFCKLMLPQQLRPYVLDHLNFSNKFDKEMALTNNLLVILDEIEQIRPSQYAELKHTLSKNRVNGREIYARTQNDRLRFASFVATTNNPKPLNDPTGSRRFICINIPAGMEIDNTQPIDYDQLYAQVLAEVTEQKLRYWLTTEEEQRLVTANVQFQHIQDLDEIVDECFRLPKEGEHPLMLTADSILDIISKHYNYVQKNHSTGILLSQALRMKGYKKEHRHSGNYYFIVPRNAA